MERKKISLIFGAKSPEHEISILSAKSIYNNIDKKIYKTELIYLDEKNKAFELDEKFDLENKEKLSTEKLISKLKNTDLVFPVIHGKTGEDGIIQGFLEFLNVKYLGSKVNASSICMAKHSCKDILKANNFKQSEYFYFNKEDFRKEKEKIRKKIIKEINLPCFVKPSNSGSSIGISKVNKEEELLEAVEKALKTDDYIVIEKKINAREIECGVIEIEKDKLVSTGLGEIVFHNSFYDYDAKYKDENPSETIYPAEINKKTAEKIKKESVRACEILGVKGLARVDFFLEKETGEIYISEINTFPGFTNFSMYPTLAKEVNLSYSELISLMIEIALK